MKIFIMIPTFNEAENIKKLVPKILNKVIDVSILVVDDKSPDGTVEEVKKLVLEYPRKVFLLERTKKRGRGSAGIDGFKYALNQGAEVIVEMDADFSHDPRHLPKMLKAIKTCDVVLGSRFVPGGKDDRGAFRHILTIAGNFYIRKTLGLSIHDCTSGFRVFKREVLEKIQLDKLISAGPSIVQEILYKADLLGFKIKEVPIAFIDRQKGKSKLNYRIIIQSILMVLILKFIMLDLWKEENSLHD